MKGKLFLLVLVTFTLFSCSNEEEVKFSCNEKIDSWVKENLVTVRSMSRSQWKRIPSHLSGAVYVAFSKEQKIQFWKEKFAQVETLGWSGRELMHIEKAKEFVLSNEDFFTDEKLTEYQEDKLDKFFLSWVEYAIENLGWSEKEAYSIVASGYDVKNKCGDIVRPLSNNDGIYPIDPILNTKGESCNCNAKHDFCQSGWTCIAADCIDSAHGCGWIWVQSCNGLCDGI